MDPKREAWELLTQEEQAFIKPIENIQAAVFAKYQYMDEQKAKTQAILDLQNEDFKTMCADQDIDTDRAARIAAKLFTMPWYCYYISDIKANNGGWQNVFSLCTYKTPNKVKVLQPDKYPAFYEAAWNSNTDPDTAYPAILDSLNLPHDHKYISPTHYEVLATIAELYTNYASNFLIPRTGGHRIKSVDIALDKVNNNIWNMLTTTNNGQLQFEFMTGGKGKTKSKDVSVIYTVNFDELENTSLLKDLDPFDKRLYIVAGSLYNAHNEMFTVQQIYSAMGWNGTAGKRDREKIHNALVKMSKTRITIDNASELAAGYGYPDLSYEGYLLPMELIRASINGQTVDCVYHLFREPPMISFARGRKQITTIDKKLLATPVSKTNAIIALEDYLLTEISRARTGKRRKRILYSTMFTELHFKATKQQQRAKPQIEKILQYYTECQFISAFTMDADGVSFTFPERETQAKLPAKT